MRLLRLLFYIFDIFTPPLVGAAVVPAYYRALSVQPTMHILDYFLYFKVFHGRLSTLVHFWRLSFVKDCGLISFFMPAGRRGCDADAHRQLSPEGRSPRSPLVEGGSQTLLQCYSISKAVPSHPLVCRPFSFCALSRKFPARMCEQQHILCG